MHYCLAYPLFAIRVLDNTLLVLAGVHGIQYERCFASDIDLLEQILEIMSLRTFLTTGLLLWSGISAIPLQCKQTYKTCFASVRLPLFLAQYLNVTTPAPTPTSRDRKEWNIPSITATNASCPVNCEASEIGRIAYTWSSYIKVQTVATVVIVINDSDGTTKTTTNYEQSLLVNGTAPTNSVSRTDTNAAGTVTYVAGTYTM